MTAQSTPDLSEELAKRIRIVRRDVGDLLFHFTRSLEAKSVSIQGRKMNMGTTASHVLGKILREGHLLGTSRWTRENTICFTEAPIQEFHSVFSLVSIALSQDQRPRYEPYGVAVSKKWLYEQGGRPVIYDKPDALPAYPSSLQYRLCPYDPSNGIDYTWEREWRIKADRLNLDPKHTLVVVPSSEEAFEIVYEHSEVEPDVDADGSASGVYHRPSWLAVSLDMFGFKHVLEDA